MITNLKPSQTELKIFLLTMVVCVAAKGNALFQLSYSTDDFFSMLSPMNLNVYFMDGRFGWALLSTLNHSLGAVAPFTNTFFIFLYMACLVLAGLIVCRIWRITDNMILSTLVVLFINIHPYQAELFLFKVNAIYNAFSILFAYIGLYYSELKIKTIFLTSFCMSFALSIYQLSLNPIVITLCFAIVFEIFRQSINNNSFNWKQILHNTKLLPRMLTIWLGVFFYLIGNKVLQNILHTIPSERFQFISIYDILHRLIEIKDVLLKMFFLPEPIMPIALKVILAILAFLAIFVCTSKIFSENLNKGTMVNFLLVLVVLFISLMSIVGVPLIVKTWWPVPRVLSSIGYFWAGVISLAFFSASKKIHLIVVILSSIVLFGFAGINNHIYTDQVRLNMRDFHKANRIIYKLENHPEFSRVQRVTLIGGDWNFPSAIDTAIGDMNISAFSKSWSKLNILKELSGYNFAQATENEQEKAEAYCSGAPKWPAPESLIIDGALCIICL